MNAYLAHHGIKGMKWGVRRFRNEDGSLTEAGKARYQKDAVREENNRVRKEYLDASRNRRLLSDEEIVQRINRLKLEKQLKDLTDENVYPGRTAVKNILTTAGSRIATNATAGATAYAGKAIMTKALDAYDAASYIFPNPNKKK